MIKINPDLDVNSENIIIWEKGQEGGRKRPIIEEYLFKNMCEVKQVLDEYNVKYCLSHGTVLGLIRDNHIIPWDDDIDIALFIEDKDKIEKVHEELRNLGFFVPREGDPEKPVNGFGKNYNMPYYDLVAIKRGEKIEGWFFEQHENYYVYDPKRSGLAIPRKFMDTFSTYNWNGVEFNIPDYTEEYLVWMYDANWKIPNKNKKYNQNRE